jgi:hypothetical protein
MKSAAVLACALSLGAVLTAPRPAAAQAAPAAPAACSPEGELKFVCGLTNVEDFLPVGGGRWLIGGSYKAGSAGLYLIDTAKKTAGPATLSIAARPDPIYNCTPPDLKALSTHGLDVRTARDGTATVFTINHGGRESVEVWRLHPARNAAEWIGCIVDPPGVNGNSVVSLSGGRIALTKFMDTNAKQGIRNIMAGEVTGAVLVWTPGKGFAEVPGSQLSGDNGLVASPDGKWLYINAYGTREIWRVPLSGQGERTHVQVDFYPDNLRWAPDGKLFVTGQFLNPANLAGRHGWATVRLDPAAMTVTPVVKEAGTAAFDDATSAVQVGDTLWLGTFRGDRVAYMAAP